MNQMHKVAGRQEGLDWPAFMLHHGLKIQYGLQFTWARSTSIRPQHKSVTLARQTDRTLSPQEGKTSHDTEAQQDEKHLE